MPFTVRQITLWRSEVDNKPGALASTIEPPAKAGADLKVIMGYRHPTAEGKAAIEVFPITGKKLVAAAGAAGLGAATIPTLLVEGDNKPGLGYAVAQTIAGGGINVAFLVAQVIGKKFAAVIGFETEDDAWHRDSILEATRNDAADRERETVGCVRTTIDGLCIVRNCVEVLGTRRKRER